MIDSVFAAVLVWSLVHALWIAAVLSAAAAGGALAWWWQQHRPGGVTDQRRAVARLTVRVAQLEADPGIATVGEVHELRLQAFLSREAAAAEAARAQQAGSLALALAGDVVKLQQQLSRALDAVRLAELEATTEWEVDR